MIAFNGQYLDKASHGNMRITAACLGGQWVFDYTWLNHATQQAIIAAFGAEEGKAVISRTKDYLNQIATTDLQRAQQLAMFINEDPLLVTSLVETSKTRWLVGDGVAYIDSGHYLNSKEDIYFRVLFQQQATSQYYSIMGSYSDTFSTSFWTNNNNYVVPVRYSGRTEGPVFSGVTMIGVEHEISFVGAEVKIDGVTIYTGSITNDVTQTNTLPIFTYYSGGLKLERIMKAMLSYVKIGTSFHLLPFIRNGENGMLDIISGTFYPNANTQGSFTIAITDKE